jgi:hypothetical protein
MKLKYGSYGYDFELSELPEKQYEEWNQFVEGSPQGTVFQKTTWLKSFDDYKFKLIALTHKNNIVAGIPLVYTSRFGVKFAIHPPFTGYLGVMFRDSIQKYNTRLSFEKEFSNVAAKQLNEFAQYVSYTFHYNFLDANPFISNGYSVKPYYMYVLNLEKDQNGLLEDMEKDTRNRIKRAEQYNLDCTEASPAEIAKLICTSFERKNQSPQYSKETYEKFLNKISQNVPTKSIMIKNKKEPIAGGCIIYDKKRAYYLFGGINSDKEHKGINQLVIWTLIKFVKEDLGLKEFDLQGWPNDGIERFLRGFGGKLTQGISIYKTNTYCRIIDTARTLRHKVKF